MTIYRVYGESTIEAKDIKAATDNLALANSLTDNVFFTTDYSAAKEAFDDYECAAPHKLSGGLYWFDGCMIESAEADEPEEETEIELLEQHRASREDENAPEYQELLKELFFTAISTEIEDVKVGDFDED